LRSDVLKNIFLQYIEEMLSFFTTVPATLENLALRENFAILVRGIGRSLYYFASPGQTFRASLRRDLFALFERWCVSEPNDPQQSEDFRKRLESFLTTVKDPKQKKDYTAVVQEKSLALQFASLQAATVLLLGPHWGPVTSGDTIFDWMAYLLHAEHSAIVNEAYKTLAAFMQGNRLSIVYLCHHFDMYPV